MVDGPSQTSREEMAIADDPMKVATELDAPIKRLRLRVNHNCGTSSSQADSTDIQSAPTVLTLLTISHGCSNRFMELRKARFSYRMIH
jgi:hypothetical protein